jgi:hypothetical protein
MLILVAKSMFALEPHHPHLQQAPPVRLLHQDRA